MMKMVKRTLTIILCLFSFALNAFSDIVTRTSVADTYVSIDAPTSPHGSETTIGISTYQSMLGYLRFDFSSIPSNISIQSAKLKLYCPSSAFSTGSILLARAANSWSESTLTWNNRINGISPSVTFNTPGSTGWWTIDVTNIVKEWLEKGGSNYGFRLEKGESGLILVSSKENSSYVPKLDITYEVNRFSVSGKVTGSQNEGVQQVELSFSRVSGSGNIPNPIYTSALGEWSQSDFEVGTTYRVTPRHTIFNYAFNPPFSDFNGSSGNIAGLNFTTTTTYSITFTSVPTGATVSTSGYMDQTTPCTFTGLVSAKVFTITKKGYNNVEYDATQADAGKTINVVLIETKPIAEIIDFVVPNGLKERETNQTIQVTIKNNGNVSRSFWVGISFANQFASGESWPSNWYDIYPKESDVIFPGNNEVLTFNIKIPRNWIAGQYYATAAIWDAFDEDNFIMIGLPSDKSSQFDIPFDRLTWHAEFTDKPDVGKQTIYLSTFDNPIALESIYGQLITEFSNGTIDELYHLHGLKPLFFVSLKTQYNFMADGFPLNISAGGALFFDLADFCEYTPEGKEGWTTVWIASKIGAISFDLTKAIESIKPGLTFPVDAGIALKQFDYNKRGIADLRLDRLEYGNFSVRGLSITAFSYEWGGNAKFLNIKTGGSFQKGFKFAAADATNYVYKFEINTNKLKYALELADLTLSFQNSSEYVDKVLKIIEGFQDTPLTFRKFTYDDGYWEIQNGIPERNLSMDKTDGSWLNSKNCFKLNVPENTTKLTLSTREGIGVPQDGYGDLRIFWRKDHPVFETGSEFDGWSSNNEGSVNEDCIINNPQSGMYYIALPIYGSTTNRYENVTFYASYEVNNNVIAITSPNGGENWQVGSIHNITWTSTGTSENVRIEYSTNNGTNWTNVISSTPDDGSQSWTVANSPSSSCLIRVTDIDNDPADVSNSTFTIASGPNITLSSPNGGENWQVGSIHNITWTSTGSSENVRIEYSTNNGTNWTNVISSTPDDGSQSWTVPNSPSSSCLIRVTDIDNDPADVSNSTFTITSGPNITLSSPNGGENWQVGSIHNITWTSTGTSGNVRIEYSTNNGTNWINVISSTPDDGSQSWTVPNSPSSSCLIRVTDIDNDPADVSNSVFTISLELFLSVTPPTITLASSSASSGNLNVTSNTNWSVTNDAIWLNLSSSFGSGNGTVTISAASANTLNNPRIANVTFSGSEVSSVVVTVTQVASTNIPAIEFNPNLTYGTVTDVDQNVYRTIQIGNQLWMAENLKTTHFNDNSPIQCIEEDAIWAGLTSSGYCWYDNNPGVNKALYGALYNWYTISTNKLCPINWHVPTNDEWIILLNFLGGESSAGTRLKEIGATHWLTDNSGTNESGFTALPGGTRYIGVGLFSSIGQRAAWWSATLPNVFLIWGYQENVFCGSFGNPAYGFSVRCIHDDISTFTNSTTTSNIKIFPNPVSDILTIEYQEDIYKIINILNSQGVLLEKVMVVSPRQQLDFTKYEYGLYILEFVNSGGVAKRIKVVNH